MACWLSIQIRNGLNPIMMYATVVYAAMRGIRSVDTIEDLCKRDLAFIWLTQGKQPKRDKNAA